MKEFQRKVSNTPGRGEAENRTGVTQAAQIIRKGVERFCNPAVRRKRLGTKERQKLRWRRRGVLARKVVSRTKKKEPVKEREGGEKIKEWCGPNSKEGILLHNSNN